MRSLLLVCLVGPIVLLAVPGAMAQVQGPGTGAPASDIQPSLSGASSDNTADPGLVYAYGSPLEGPDVFTESEDGRTLYLNGLLYDGPGEGPLPQITVTETVRSQHELSVAASEASRQAKTYEERRSVYADVLRQSQLVTKVREFDQGVYVTWRSSPQYEEEVIIPREEPSFDLEEFRHSLIGQFWHTVNSGGMIAFGERYHVYVPPVRLPKTIEQIDRVRSGVARDQLDVANTALQNKSFLGDLYRAAQSPGEGKP